MLQMRRQFRGLDETTKLSLDDKTKLVFCKSLPFFIWIFYFVAHLNLYYNNSGYTMFSRYLKIVIILDIVIPGDK